MPDVALAYGRSGLTVRFPDERTTVVQPRHHAAAPDPAATLATALREPVAGPPLRAKVRPGQQVAVSLCDATRPQPRREMSAAATVVRPGGLIVCAAECSDGFPDHGEFREVLASASTPQALLATIAGREKTVPD